MANTLIPIQTYALSATTASVTFSNIPQNYTDLRLVASTRTDYATTYGTVYATFNGSGTGYTARDIQGSGASAISYTDTKILLTSGVGASATASTFSNAELYITNYAGSSYKSTSTDSVGEHNATTAYINFDSGLWSNTAAITSLTLTPSQGNFVSGSTFTLYGVSNGVKAAGGTVICAGGYAYHTFTSTGSFLPNQKITNAEVLMVAGGGGGSKGLAGGGGAGGVTYAPNIKLNAGTTYTALIGSGGAGSTSTSVNGTNGGNSVFASAVTAIGGGGGGATDQNDGSSGGSGGGCGWLGGTGGSPTSGQGYAGANALYSGFSGGGGGGAGGVGVVAGTNSRAGDGGPGTSTYSTWHAITGTGVLSSGLYYIAGGGGGGGNNSSVGTVYRDGGYGGVGGGGTGGRPSSPTAGTANTGGGGAGGQGNSPQDNGAAGGSGLIIVRYPIN